MALVTTPTHPSADSYATVAEADAYFQNRSNVENWSTLSNDQKEAALRLATRHIDSLRFFDRPFYTDPVEYRDRQMLHFPEVKQEGVRTGAVSSAAAAYVTAESLANQSQIPDDYYNGGALVIVSGTGKGQVSKISDFESATGKVTVDANFSTQPDATSTFRIFPRIAEKVKYAVFEQALYILSGGGDRKRMQAEGVTSFSLGDLSESYGGSAIGAGMSRIPVCPDAKGYLRGLWTIGGAVR